LSGDAKSINDPPRPGRQRKTLSHTSRLLEAMGRTFSPRNQGSTASAFRPSAIPIVRIDINPPTVGNRCRQKRNQQFTGQGFSMRVATKSRAVNFSRGRQAAPQSQPSIRKGWLPVPQIPAQRRSGPSARGPSIGGPQRLPYAKSSACLRTIEVTPCLRNNSRWRSSANSLLVESTSLENDLSGLHIRMGVYGRGGRQIIDQDWPGPQEFKTGAINHQGGGLKM